MSRFDWKNVAERVAWTFVQGALSIPFLDAFNMLDANLWKAMAAGGVAAALSLVKNMAAEQLQGTPAVPPAAAEDSQ